MKKKGLIISTVVMVVVLIASLTTATYAWFSVSASATITNITINTNASDGLVIASYDPTASTVAYYSGEVYATDCAVSTQSDKFWGSDYENGFGASITFTTIGEETEQIKNMFATSGDGVSMFKNAAEQQVLGNNSKPENVGEASANVNYFVLDFMLQSTSATDGKLFIKQLNVTPSAQQANMAGSVRIALFKQATKDAPTKAESWDVTTNGVFAYDPYGYQKLTNGVWQAGNDADTIKYVKGAGAYSSNLSDPGAFKTLWGSKYFTHATVTPAVPAAKEYGGASGYADSEAAIAGNSLFDLGTFEAGKFMTLRLVVWFEGEDSACVQATAGGGITLQINFGLDVASAG